MPDTPQTPPAESGLSLADEAALRARLDFLFRLVPDDPAAAELKALLLAFRRGECQS